jgi:hypothetical protein
VTHIRGYLRETAVKKGRHRRFEEARELKRGPDIDIEAIFNASNAADDDDLDRTVSGRAGWFDDEG